MNIIRSRNGQSQSEAKPKGRFTGERLLRERPKVYRKVVELLAEPGMSINQITKFCRVSEHTVRAVRDREGVSIAERKQRLMSIFGNIAEIAAERMEELAGQASLRDAGTTAGIATDKLLALSSDPLTQANNRHLHLHLEPVDLIGQWNEMISKLNRSALEAKDPLPKPYLLDRFRKLRKPQISQRRQTVVRGKKTSRKKRRRARGRDIMTAT